MSKTLLSTVNSIYRNLAIERFFYKTKPINEPILLFYQNDRSVIIGRNQNPWKECKLETIERDGVDLCRRYSGGGAVY